MFTRRHEQELAEIKALAHELERQVQESQERLARIMASRGTAPLLAFVHIPKTAGGTVTSMLAAAYSRQAVHDAGNFVRAPQKAGGKISSVLVKGGRVSAGHIPYGFFRKHLPPDTRYMTFLREPVDRVLSHYYRHIHRKDPRRAGGRKELASGSPKANSLEEAIVDMGLPQLSNLSTRFLCGHPSPMGELPPSALDDAKENLRAFAFIGIQERFEESLVLLQRMLGLGRVPYRDRHVSSDRPTVDEMPGHERELVEEYNRLDAELYEFALPLFEERVGAVDDRFAADVEALRAESPTVREENWRKAAFAGQA
jgi:Sulfotransferase family